MSTANSSGTANIVAPSNVARGAVVALITVAETFNSCNQTRRVVHRDHHLWTAMAARSRPA